MLSSLGWRLVAATVFTGAAASPLVAQSVASTVRSITLTNGLQVIVVKNPSIPFVTLEMVFRAGAFTQSAGEEGIPHLIEHMLFRRGEAGGDSFDEEAAKIDAAWNGVTDTESVRYYLTFPTKYLSAGMNLISNLIRKPSFSKDALEAERKVVQGELERRASEPLQLLWTESDILLWAGGDGAGWRSKNPGGNIPALMNTNPDKLSALYKRFYVPNNAALVVSGNVNETEVFDLANKIFRGWKPGPDPLAELPPPVIAPLTAPKRQIQTADVKDVTMLIRWQGPSVGKNRGATYAADVFAGLVNQPLSKTQRRLVDGGLFDNVYLRYLTKNYVGPIELVASTTPDRAVAAAEALGAELSKLTEPDYFDDSDLVLAKKRQQVYAHFLSESASASAHVLGEFWGSAGLDYFIGYADSLDVQKREDIQRFVAAYIKGKPMVANALVPQDSWTKIGPTLQRTLGAWRVP